MKPGSGISKTQYELQKTRSEKKEQNNREGGGNILGVGGEMLLEFWEVRGRSGES